MENDNTKYENITVSLKENYHNDDMDPLLDAIRRQIPEYIVEGNRTTEEDIERNLGNVDTESLLKIDENGNSMFHFLAFYGSPFALNTIINKIKEKREYSDTEINEFINKPNKEGKTPLVLATERKNLDVVKSFLNNGAKIENNKENNNIIFGFMAEKGDKELTEFIVNMMNKEQIDYFMKEVISEGKTLMNILLGRGDLGLTKIIVEKDKQKPAVKPAVKPPESKPIETGGRRKITIPTAQFKLVSQPKGTSTNSRRTKNIRSSEQQKQESNEQQEQNNGILSSFLYSAIQGNNPEVVEYLLENDYKIEKNDLNYAVLGGNIEIANLILSKIKEDCKNKTAVQENLDKLNGGDERLRLSSNCLEKAIENKNKEMVSFLINNFYGINKPRQFHTGKDTPLQFAIKTKNVEMIEYLINEKNAPIYPINPQNSPIENNYSNDVNYLKEAIKTGNEGIFNLIKEAYSKKLQVRNVRSRGTKKKDLRSILKLENNSCLFNAITSKNPEIIKSVIGELKYSDLLKGLGNPDKNNAIDLLYSDDYKSLRAEICKDNSEIEYKIRKAKLKQEIEEMKEVESISKKTIKVLNFDFKRDNLSFLSTNLKRLKKQIKERREILQNLKDLFKKMKEKQEKILNMMLKIDEKQGNISKTQIEESTTTQVKIITPEGKSTAKTARKGNQKVTGSTKLEPMKNEEKTKIEKTDIEQALLDAEKELTEGLEKEGITFDRQKGTFTVR